MRKLALLTFALTLLILAVPIAVSLADVSVGVKKGDWIQYQVAVTGNPPGDHNIRSAGMNVTNVQDTAISLDIQTEFVNGTILSEHITLDLVTGVLGDDFFIPKNLNVGDKFYDSSQGNITITNVEQRTAAGTQRTVVSASTDFTTYYWDRETGILVAATSHEPDYIMETEANATNIWQPQNLGSEPTLVYTVIVTLVIVLAVIVTLFVRNKRKK